MWQSCKCQATRMYRPGSVAGFQIVENPYFNSSPPLCPWKCFCQMFGVLINRKPGLQLESARVFVEMNELVFCLPEMS
jgi:hypothetical protein